LSRTARQALARYCSSRARNRRKRLGCSCHFTVIRGPYRVNLLLTPEDGLKPAGVGISQSFRVPQACAEPRNSVHRIEANQTMNHSRLRLSKLSLGLIVALAAAPAFAQSTSAGVGGLVTGADGNPVAGAEVTITHVESGTVSRATTDDSGRYTARGLRVGGPYTITVTKAGTGTDTEEGIYLDLNKVNAVNAQLGSTDATTLGTVAVTASRMLDTFNPDNKGVGTSISGRQLEILPAGSRSLDDAARMDPRVTVIDQAGGAISVAGINNRYNTISV